MEKLNLKQVLLAVFCLAGIMSIAPIVASEASQLQEFAGIRNAMQEHQDLRSLGGSRSLFDWQATIAKKLLMNFQNTLGVTQARCATLEKENKEIMRTIAWKDIELRAKELADVKKQLADAQADAQARAIEYRENIAELTGRAQKAERHLEIARKMEEKGRKALERAAEQEKNVEQHIAERTKEHQDKARQKAKESEVLKRKVAHFEFQKRLSRDETLANARARDERFSNASRKKARHGKENRDFSSESDHNHSD